MSRCGCTLAVGGSVAERLAIPAPVINKELDEEDRRYLVPINHLENRDHDFTSEAILKTVRLFTDRQYAVGDWKCPGNVSGVQIYSDEVEARYGVLEGSVNILGRTEMIQVALCMTLHAADGSRFDKEQTEAFAARFELPVVPLEEALEGYKFGS
jgi:3,4-dihydroxy-2-butanone 4-phosphate synthase